MTDNKLNLALQKTERLMQVWRKKHRERDIKDEDKISGSRFGQEIKLRSPHNKLRY